MKKIYFAALVIIAVAAFFFFRNISNNKPANIPPASQPEKIQADSPPQNVPPVANPNDFQPPLARSGDRVTKKYFGIFITPQNSPIQPERFSGYHTGADFEIFPEELNAEVPVHAVCSGNLKLKEYAGGYGGVAIQACSLNGESMTVIYGHLKLSSIEASMGTQINAGDTIGILGADHSSETSGERKHLHLGFHKGTATNILGYVNSQSALSGWVDPCLYVCHN